MSITPAPPGTAPLHETEPDAPPRTASVRDDHQRDRTGVSRSAWRQVRRLVTIAVFALATATGVHVGLQGPAVSPVAPAVAAAPAVVAATPDSGGNAGQGAGDRPGNGDGAGGGGRR